MIRRKYACPDCAHQFVYDHHPSIAADPVPRFCSHCGFDSEGEFETPPVAPAIHTGMVQRTDNLMRAVDEGADHRANVAREALGLDAESARMIADTSTAPVNNAVTQHMADPRISGSVGLNPAGIGYSSTVSQGPFPNAGLRALQSVRAHHQKATTGIGHAGATVSDLPGLETQSPLYKRRA